jgi:hypothetical protein
MFSMLPYTVVLWRKKLGALTRGGSRGGGYEAPAPCACLHIGGREKIVEEEGGGREKKRKGEGVRRERRGRKKMKREKEKQQERKEENQSRAHPWDEYRIRHCLKPN